MEVIRQKRRQHQQLAGDAVGLNHRWPLGLRVFVNQVRLALEDHAGHILPPVRNLAQVQDPVTHAPFFMVDRSPVDGGDAVGG